MLDLDALERVHREATKGPWQEHPEVARSVCSDADSLLTEDHEGYYVMLRAEDCAAVVALHNAAPELIREVRRLRKDNARLVSALGVAVQTTNHASLYQEWNQLITEVAPDA